MACRALHVSGLVAFGLLTAIACSKAPDYAGAAKQSTNVATSQNAQGAAGPQGTGHGETADDTPPTNNVPTAPATPPAPLPPTAQLTPDAGSYKAMMGNQQMYSVVRVSSFDNWGTSADKPAEVKVAVDAAGAMAPASVRTQMFLKAPIPASGIDYKNPPKLEFVNAQGAAVAVTGMTSVLVVCNDQATAIYLHSTTGGAPFAHGNGSIKQGQCAAFPAQNVNAITAGATYDHLAGDKPTTRISMKMVKIGPDGNVVP